jgi:hypothetical protein
VKLTVFTVEEANALLVELRPRFERLVAAKRELDRLQVQAGVLGVATAGASAENPDAIALRRIVERRAALAQQLSAGVNAIHRRGALVKDLDQGLLDFYAVSGDRLIFLCWRMGESEISHWHTLEGGFAQRQPIDHSGLE